MRHFNRERSNTIVNCCIKPTLILASGRALRNVSSAVDNVMLFRVDAKLQQTNKQLQLQLELPQFLHEIGHDQRCRATNAFLAVHKHRTDARLCKYVQYSKTKSTKKYIFGNTINARTDSKITELTLRYPSLRRAAIQSLVVSK